MLLLALVGPACPVRLGLPALPSPPGLPSQPACLPGAPTVGHCVQRLPRLCHASFESAQPSPGWGPRRSPDFGPYKLHGVGFGFGLRYDRALRPLQGPPVHSPPGAAGDITQAWTSWQWAGLRRVSVGGLCLSALHLGRAPNLRVHVAGRVQTFSGSGGTAHSLFLVPLPWVGLRALSHGSGGEADLTLLPVLQAAGKILEEWRKRRPWPVGVGRGAQRGVAPLGLSAGAHLALLSTFILHGATPLLPAV